jgi:hypothetical protein
MSVSLSPISGSRFQSPAGGPRVTALHLPQDPPQAHTLPGATGSGKESWGAACAEPGDAAETCKPASSHASRVAAGGVGSKLSSCQQWHPAAAADHLQFLQHQQQQHSAQSLDADLRSHDASSPTTSDMAASNLLVVYQETIAKTGWVMSPRGSITWMGPGEPPRGLPQVNFPYVVSYYVCRF